MAADGSVNNNNDINIEKRNREKNRTAKSGKHQYAWREGKLQVLRNMDIGVEFGIETCAIQIMKIRKRLMTKE